MEEETTKKKKSTARRLDSPIFARKKRPPKWTDALF